MTGIRSRGWSRIRLSTGTLALNYLRHEPAIGQRELGERLSLDANNTGLLLNDLELDDLAERRRHPRTAADTSSTSPLRGGSRWSAPSAVESLEHEVLRGLTTEQRQTLRHLLQLALDGVPVDA